MRNKIVAIIQARLGSTRFPAKVMETVGGVPMLKRVWLAAKNSWADQTVVAWPERYPDLDESNVLARFRRVAEETGADIIVRLTSDCPLLTSQDINEAIRIFNKENKSYYSNHLDGKDVQVFKVWVLFSSGVTHREHVIADFKTQRKPYGVRSVDTPEDLQHVRKLCATK